MQATRILDLRQVPDVPVVSIARVLESAKPTAPPASVYLHIPFCFHKCHYCDFYSIVDQDDRQAVFVDRLIDEMTAWAPFAVDHLDTIFVGGGTPTLLAVPLWRRLVAAIHEHFCLDRDIEFTVEANPETVTDELMEVLAAGGVNRVSIGAQSFNPTHLKTLERWHNPANVARALASARRAGITRTSLDLIFAIPGQTLADWRGDLQTALSLDPEHLSCYALTFEPNTALFARWRAGQIDRLDESLELEMFRTTRDALATAGFSQYEISNFSRPGAECRHNLAYWHDDNWLALGPSASGHIANHRWKNIPRLADYLAGSGFAPLAEHECLPPPTRLAERIMLGLRLNQGLDLVSIATEARRIDRESALLDVVTRRVESGELIRADNRLTLSSTGQELADLVIGELMAAVDP